MYTSTFHVPAPVAAPRVAPFAATMAYQTIAGLRSAAVLTGAFIARMSRAVAPRRDAFPQRSETASLRRYAQQMMSQDPSFAADLFAAADRHERGE